MLTSEARQGNPYVQFSLGVLYDKSQGVPRNKVVAYALANLSAAQDSSGDGNASKHRSMVAQGMTAQKIEAGKALSAKMSVPGNLLKALDQYLAGSIAKRQ